jgi:hypothetical protein
MITTDCGWFSAPNRSRSWRGARAPRAGVSCGVGVATGWAPAVAGAPGVTGVSGQRPEFLLMTPW